MRFLLVAFVVVIIVYSLVECLQADPTRVRLMPRLVWGIVILLVPAVGAVGWLLFGRPLTPESPGGSAGRRAKPVSPDDDPDFLRSLRQPKPPKRSAREGNPDE